MKIIVGMSGGVDSSVAALLLIEQGFEVEGLFMRNWDSAINQDVEGNPDIDLDTCPQETDFLDAQRVCDQLGIHLHRHDFVHEYWDHVFATFLRELEAGRTPNPDILCNKHIKFDQFISAAKALGAYKIAMGHFARIDSDVPPKLLRGVDANKDQSYFLCQIAQDDLNDVIFPIGHLTKAEVRALAKKHGLQTASKPDSTGICFIGERRFSQFLSNYFSPHPGDIISENHEILGRHDGLMYYTIGQRKGLRIGGDNRFQSLPWFVSDKDVTHNTLTVVQGFHHPKLYSTHCFLEDFNWVSRAHRQPRFAASAKFRYRQADVQVNVEMIDETKLHVTYLQGVRAVTPGQACVLYQGEVMIGGGTIDRVFYEDETRHIGVVQ
ncbi:MAG: tRNA 2-thiouridine(34) synthase MnmA [Candidatus Izemoplasmatales bacterium]|nr:tRNA 2-thiouridine(34) synthase MnmA [Candidatus Izemoplasmatales bacterium]MDD5292911.1 tRNA 2-thiouridine(34) synthase MnmA [Candidatus Izemoplasmatales bacterium]